jgi:acetate kinase
MSAPSRVLCLNSGSSSLKLALYDDDTRLASITVEGIGSDGGRITTRDNARRIESEAPGTFADTQAALRAAFSALDAAELHRPDAVGHRVVHGGPHYAAPERITTALVAALRALTPFAPLHLPAAIAGIEAVTARFHGVPQVACFDTAFHRRMPEVSQRLPLPRALWARGVRRYGFHGLSYEYVVATVGAATLGRAVIAHLGNGASMAAVRDGAAVDTTMGFTPTGGFMMGTRSGDLDPGVLVHLLAHEGYDVAAVERLVDQEAGLLGVSGITADMKTLLAVRQHEPAAAEAVELFCHQLRKNVGALAAVLGGIDTLVFTGGIGEHAALVRWEACSGLEHLGIRLDRERNARRDPIISVEGSACTVRVVPTDEDLMIARHTRTLLGTIRAER